MMREMMKNLGMKKSVGVDGDPETDADRNWNSERRLREQEADGWVAEVIFPNTQPPFAPMARSQLEAPPVGDDVEHRLGGPAGPQPLARRLRVAGARAPRRVRPDLPGRRRGLGGRDRVGGGAQPAGRHRAPGRSARLGLPPAVRGRVRAHLGGVRGERDAGQPPQRRRHPRLRHAPARVHRHVHARGHLVGAPPAVAPDVLGRVRAASRTCTSATPRAARSGSSTRCPSSTASTTG